MAAAALASAPLPAHWAVGIRTRTKTYVNIRGSWTLYLKKTHHPNNFLRKFTPFHKMYFGIFHQKALNVF
jgi:hypothetical protein